MADYVFPGLQTAVDGSVENAEFGSAIPVPTDIGYTIYPTYEDFQKGERYTDFWLSKNMTIVSAVEPTRPHTGQMYPRFDN
jgi:hypothetical protein